MGNYEIKINQKVSSQPLPLMLKQFLEKVPKFHDKNLIERINFTNEYT